MKYRLLEWLSCPVCRSPDLRLETVATRTVAALKGHFREDSVPPGVDLERGEEQEVMEGSLHCGQCGTIYPIREGVPRLMAPESEQGPSSRHHETRIEADRVEWEENFRDLAAPLEPGDFLGKLVLDAGCGFGRHAFFAARYGAEVVAIDSSTDAVSAAFRNTESLARVHVVQADVYRPPFREDCFDIAYSFGVLHHLQHPVDAFKTLGELVRPGGRLSVWVYGPRQGITLAASEAVRGFTTELDADRLEMVSAGIAGCASSVIRPTDCCVTFLLREKS